MPQIILDTLGELTVGSIKTSLLDVISSLDVLISNAAGEFRDSIREVKKNLEDVSATVEKKYGNMLDKTIGGLSEVQIEFFEDVARTINVSTAAVSKASGDITDDLEELVHEADIAAYNTAYSLPCREQIPRVVYTKPEVLRIGTDESVVELVGNFLGTSGFERAYVKEHEAEVISVSGGSVVLKIPQIIIDNVESVETVGATLHLQKKAFFPFCIPRKKPAQVQAVIRLEQPTRFKVQGYIEGSYTKVTPERLEELVQEFPAGRIDLSSGNCNQNSVTEVERQVPDDGWRAIEVRELRVNDSASGGSHFAGYRTIDNRAIIKIHLKGAGYDIFGICKGRAWFRSDHIVIKAAKTIKHPEIRELIQIGREDMEVEGAPGLKNIAEIRHSRSTEGLNEANWRYKFIIRQYIGTRELSPVELSSESPTSGGYTSDITNGIAYIRVE